MCICQWLSLVTTYTPIAIETINVLQVLSLAYVLWVRKTLYVFWPHCENPPLDEGDDGKSVENCFYISECRDCDFMAGCR